MICQEIRVIKVDKIMVFYLACVNPDKALWFPIVFKHLPRKQCFLLFKVNPSTSTPESHTTTTLSLISCRGNHLFLYARFAFHCSNIFRHNELTPCMSFRFYFPSTKHDNKIFCERLGLSLVKR